VERAALLIIATLRLPERGPLPILPTLNTPWNGCLPPPLAAQSAACQLIRLIGLSCCRSYPAGLFLGHIAAGVNCATTHRRPLPTEYHDKTRQDILPARGKSSHSVCDLQQNAPQLAAYLTGSGASAIFSCSVVKTWATAVATSSTARQQLWTIAIEDADELEPGWQGCTKPAEGRRPGVMACTALCLSVYLHIRREATLARRDQVPSVHTIFPLWDVPARTRLQRACKHTSRSLLIMTRAPSASYYFRGMRAGTCYRLYLPHNPPCHADHSQASQTTAFHSFPHDD
jgi:hypothetical protein